MRLKEIKPGMVVHYKTENEANRLLWELIHLGYRWWNGRSICKLHFEDNVNGCGYCIKNDKTVDWGRIGYYRERTAEYGEIILFSSLIIEEKTYEDGLNEAWKFLRKIYDLKCDDIEEIFNTNGGVYGVISSTIPIKDMISKLESYEAEKQIEVGDVVNVINNESYDSKAGIFLGEDYKHYWVLLPKYSVPQCLGISRYTLKKTGKQIDISSILAEIGKE